ncbi:hypothetical protein AAKU61_004666, partial [Undibacterium sp. GrIS 1.2]|uniref:HNH/endonuclease VII fold toxin-2 domain-containing protein n=2 Tax=unclassified Undibacterium TaxID=2630295 RepID=UPI003395DDCB
GGIVESTASGLDASAEFATSGKLPNMVALASAYAQRMVMSKIDKITKLIPGVKGEINAVKAETSAAKAELNAEKNAVKSELAEGKKDAKKEAKKSDKKNDASPPGDGVKVVGSSKDGGRCKLRPYKEGCPSGTPHHVVPDHCFKQPGDNGAYYPGGIKHADGLCICVEGATKSTGSDGTPVKNKSKLNIKDVLSKLAEHGKIHALFDPLEEALGKLGSPQGTAKLGQLEKTGAMVVGKVVGCDPQDLEKQLRSYHQSKGLDPSVSLRADPFGQIRNLDSIKMGQGSKVADISGF